MSSYSNSNLPYTRSRTNLFLSYRSSSSRIPTSINNYDDNSYSSRASQYDDENGNENGSGHGGESSRLMGEMDDTIIDMSSAVNALPPKWVDFADSVDEILSKIKPKMNQLDKLHSRHLLPGFNDRSIEEKEIDDMAIDITRDFRATQKIIRRIAEMSKALLGSRSNSSAGVEAKRLDLIMAANVQTALATKVQDLSALFRKKQTEYLRQLKGLEGKGQEYSPYVASKDPLASLVDDEQYSQSLLATQSTLAQPDLSQRDAEISSIAQSITDLADLFKDLSSLVIDQGTLLDRVDYNIEQIGVDVKGAVEELKVATTYQKRSGKCQLIFLLLLLIVAAFILLYFKPSRSTSPPSPIPIPIDPTSVPRSFRSTVLRTLKEEGGSRRRSWSRL